MIVCVCVQAYVWIFISYHLLPQLDWKKCALAPIACDFEFYS